jgi:steroid delta-isomerase-like uncharacterized protein
MFEPREVVMGKAADLHRKAHQSFNARDWKAVEEMMVSNCEYEDHPRGVTMKDSSEFTGWLKEWASAMSDAEVADVDYIDGGSYSIARFTGRGTNDGAFGPFPASGKRLAMPFCEVMHWNDDGRCDRGEIYYDQMTMLVQFGHADPPPQG